MEEKNNVVSIRPMPHSYYKPDGGAILTGALDAVLFNEFEKQNKLLNELIVVNSKWKSQYEAQEGQLKRWRWCAYLGTIAFWVALFTPQIVKAFLP